MKLDDIEIACALDIFEDGISIPQDEKIKNILEELFYNKINLKQKLMDMLLTDRNGTKWDSFESYYKYGDMFIFNE